MYIKICFFAGCYTTGSTLAHRNFGVKLSYTQGNDNKMKPYQFSCFSVMLSHQNAYSDE